MVLPFQHDNRDHDSYSYAREPRVEVDNPRGIEKSGNGKGNGPVVESPEIAIIAMEVVSTFSFVPAYVPCWS